MLIFGRLNIKLSTSMKIEDDKITKQNIRGMMQACFSESLWSVDRTRVPLCPDLSSLKTDTIQVIFNEMDFHLSSNKERNTCPLSIP